MSKIILVLAFFLASITIKAQLKTPAASPKSSLEQVVGLTNVDIVYSRPSMKTRTIFGDLVPFGKLWRTGANANTTVSFSEDILIDGKTLKKGKYALYTIPKADSWEIIFYSDTDNWGTPENWDEAKVALKTAVKPEMLDQHVETLTIGISNLDTEFAYLSISWENTMVNVKFIVPTQVQTMANIEKVLAGPSAGDYFAAAQYYYQSNGDMTTALNYVNKALEMNKDKPFWYNRQKSLIQARLGDTKGAIESAKLSLAAATLAKNNDYIKMNNDSIAEWSKK